MNEHSLLYEWAAELPTAGKPLRPWMLAAHLDVVRTYRVPSTSSMRISYAPHHEQQLECSSTDYALSPP